MLISPTGEFITLTKLQVASSEFPVGAETLKLSSKSCVILFGENTFL